MELKALKLADNLGAAKYMAVIGEMSKLIEKLERSSAEKDDKIRQLQNNVLLLQEKYDLLVHKFFGRHSERTAPDNSPTLFDDEIVTKTADTPDASCVEKETYEVAAHTRKKRGGRKPISDLLQRVERIIDLSDEEKRCACGRKLVRLPNALVREVLHIIDPKIWVERIIRYQYVCPCCGGNKCSRESGGVHCAPVEPAIIPKSMASSDLLAFIFTEKYLRYMPYYRLEKRFESLGVRISRQDMANWQVKVYETLRPLFELLKSTLRSGSVLRMDETVVQVMGEEDRKDTQKSYMWLVRGGPLGKEAALFNYRSTRASEHIREFLEGFSGYLQTDGYPGYDCAIKQYPLVTHVGCFAHARRKFCEAQKGKSDPKQVSKAIGYIRKLYAIEEKLRADKKLRVEEFVKKRKEETAPVFKSFKKWLELRLAGACKDTLWWKAVTYTLNQWDKLVAYVNSAELTPDNNTSERSIRPFVIGRKNWMFYKSPDGAHSGCALYSLIESAKLNNLDPTTYLRRVFSAAPLAVSTADWENLLPWNCK